MCLFTCLQTRAVHIEMVYSLDISGFLQALGRFCHRRGTPNETLSDNGGNFVAADRELRSAVRALDCSKVGASLTHQNILWRFNPPYSPHFGGVFESLIKSAKRALTSVLSNASLTDEELHSALVYAEGFLNNRPLTTFSSDPNDLRPLTPNHFLMGQLHLRTAPEALAEMDTAAVHHGHRWKVVLEVVKAAWQRWLHEVVPQLNIRRQWKMKKANMKENDADSIRWAELSRLFLERMNVSESSMS